MPNTREKGKLIEVLSKHIPYGYATLCLIAEELMAEGVTVQEWISVKDRLPEPFVPVLVQMPGEAPLPTVREGFISKDGIWHSALYNREPDEVTHWKPMPQPPKNGENYE